MSDEASAPATKRGGRKAPAPASEKVEAKKRPRKEIKPADSGDEDGVEPPKRGKGRPKSTKKKAAAAPKAKSASAGRRGRSKKEDKAKSSEEEKNEDEEDEEDDE